MDQTTAHKAESAADEQLEESGNKQQQQLSTGVRPLRSNAWLRAYLRAEELAAAHLV